MKRNLLIIMAMFLGTALFAQDLQLVDPTPLVTGDPELAEDNTIAVHWDVTNAGAETYNVRCRREVISLVDGARERFCWGPLCYDWGTEMSLGNGASLVTIESGASNSTFVGDYQHQGNPGTSVIRYCFYDNTDASVETCYEVTYCVDADAQNCAVSVEQISGFESQVQISPNPLNRQGTIQYTLPAGSQNGKLIIYNMVGEVMSETLLSKNEGSTVMDATALANGVYFYALVVNDQVLSTKKLVVSK